MTVVTAGALLLVAEEGAGSLLVAYLALTVVCAAIGAALHSWRWLFAVECALLGLYFLLLVLIIAKSAGSWNRRSYDLTVGALALMSISYATLLLLVILGGLTVGASVQRRLR